MGRAQGRSGSDLLFQHDYSGQMLPVRSRNHTLVECPLLVDLSLLNLAQSVEIDEELKLLHEELKQSQGLP